MLSDDEFFDRHAAYQVLGDDVLKSGGSARAVPDSFGVDHRDGSVLAHTQTAGFGARPKFHDRPNFHNGIPS